MGIELKVTNVNCECPSFRDEVYPDPTDVVLRRVRMCDLLSDSHSDVHLFACTDSVIASDYPNVRAVTSDAPCSPCRVADGMCPLGRAGCLAHSTGPLAPERIAKTVATLMGL